MEFVWVEVLIEPCDNHTSWVIWIGFRDAERDRCRRTILNCPDVRNHWIEAKPEQIFNFHLLVKPEIYFNVWPAAPLTSSNYSITISLSSSVRKSNMSNLNKQIKIQFHTIIASYHVLIILIPTWNRCRLCGTHLTMGIFEFSISQNQLNSIQQSCRTN